MIRVAFVLNQAGANWLGGVNYFRNLFNALSRVPDIRIQPVIFTGETSDVSAFDELVEIVRTPILDRKSAAWWASEFLSRIFPRRDYLLLREMRRHHIRLVSHYGRLWKGSPIPVLCWFPDFQHLHLPEHTGERGVRELNRTFRARLKQCDAVLLSSSSSLLDLETFSNGEHPPAYVLHFPSSFANEMDATEDKATLESKYHLDRPWFHIPNQFWMHKNHSVVIEALGLLKRRGHNLLVVATGNSLDHRNPDHFDRLMARIKELDITLDFRYLGVVPYADMQGLMKASVAMINPSLFEGWSTTVEEAKSLGKKILLSDIPVHREQSPARGMYFSPDNADQLATLMLQVIREFDPGIETSERQKAYSHQRVWGEEFARNYERIALAVIASASQR